MIVREPKEKAGMRGLFLLCSVLWVIMAMSVYLLPSVEANVARYRQKQEIMEWESEGDEATIDVAKQELGNPVGILTFPVLSLELPIYEGTSEKVLENGIGITEGTGNIIGGKGKNPLLAGHSGLYKNSLFDDLPSVKKDQRFYLKVNEEQHAYQIDQIKEIPKEELQRNFTKYLAPNPKEDRVTLMTCTPKGINTHRFLVYGKRVAFTKSEIKDEEYKKQKLSWKWLLGSIIFLSVMIIGLLVIYKRKK
ncbi:MULTISPECIES: class C sortase [Enterococcus]|uniref:class C sortase n=1 Tax=Enterococcus TaxID=1350 RepID=UPI0013EBBFB8|nr:class C sortase [Enterococcus sp. ZJ1622]